MSDGLVAEREVTDVQIPMLAVALGNYDEFLQAAIESIRVRQRLALVAAELRLLMIGGGGATMPYALPIGYADCGVDEIKSLFVIDAGGAKTLLS